MGRQSFRRALLITIASAVVLFQPGCDKWRHLKESIQARHRIAEIDAKLAHWKPTGKPGDANARAELRAERARLARLIGLDSPKPEPAQTPAFAMEQTPAPSPGVTPKIIVAPAQLNSAENMDAEKIRLLNITSAGGHYDARTGRIEPNSTPWHEPDPNNPQKP